MPDPLAPEGDGQTALTDEDREGLLPSYIVTRGELNDAEQRNIAAAIMRRRPPSSQRLLDDGYLRSLHRAMFGQVWAWAGQYRLRETNIGVDPLLIAVKVRDLVDDAVT
jgi:fido (protein-threonine AMPylation protein)